MTCCKFMNIASDSKEAASITGSYQMFSEHSSLAYKSLKGNLYIYSHPAESQTIWLIGNDPTKVFSYAYSIQKKGTICPVESKNWQLFTDGRWRNEPDLTRVSNYQFATFKVVLCQKLA